MIYFALLSCRKLVAGNTFTAWVGCPGIDITSKGTMTSTVLKDTGNMRLTKLLKVTYQLNSLI